MVAFRSAMHCVFGVWRKDVLYTIPVDFPSAIKLFNYNTSYPRLSSSQNTHSCRSNQLVYPVELHCLRQRAASANVLANGRLTTLVRCPWLYAHLCVHCSCAPISLMSAHDSISRTAFPCHCLLTPSIIQQSCSATHLSAPLTRNWMHLLTVRKARSDPQIQVEARPASRLQARERERTTMISVRGSAAN
jgi:hypothetical protein